MTKLRHLRSPRRASNALPWLAICLLAIAAQAQPTNSSPRRVVPPSQATDRLDLLEFLSGDVLHGTFQGADATNLLWKHPAIGQPMRVKLSSIAQLRINQRSPLPTNSGPVADVRLTNSDELLGQLLSLGQDKLQLNTWYAGQISIPRKALLSLTPGSDVPSCIYEGPTGLEGWSFPLTAPGIRRDGMPTVPWRYSNGAFTSAAAGPVSRAFAFPPLTEIEFDLSWRGYLQLLVNMFSDTPAGYGGNSYLLQLNQGAAYLQRTSRTGEFGGLGSTEVPILVQKTRAHISIRANKAQKTISLVIDGQLVKQWTDRLAFSPGTYLSFHQQGQGLTRISRLRINAWNGRFESSTAAAPGAKEDRVRLVNTDKISGTLKQIQNGKVAFRTGFATLDVPLDRVSEIEFACEKVDPAPPVGVRPWVRAVFDGIGAVSFQLERWDRQELVGVSPTLGRLVLNPAAVALLQCNLDQPRVQADLFAGSPDELETPLITE